MKSAKTAGGIKDYTTQDSTYEKWVISRPAQAEYVTELLSIADMSKDLCQKPRKCLSPREISKSESAVKKITEVLRHTLVDPFSDDLEKDKLYNLASGCPIGDDAAECILSCENHGYQMMEEFKTRILGTHKEKKKLFDPIKQAKWIGFSSNSLKAKVKFNGKIQDVVVQRDMLGALDANSRAGKSPVDLDRALCYPLAPVSLSLASSDGSRRKNNKSKFYNVLGHALKEASNRSFPTESKMYYIYDLAAALRATTKTPSTFEDLALKLLNSIDQKYKVIYIVCDTYREKTIKCEERKSRGCSDKFVIRSANVKVPSEFQEFLNNGENNERLFEIIEEVWTGNSDVFGERVVFFARKDACTRIEASGSTVVEKLSANHDEADTKIVYLPKMRLIMQQMLTGQYL